MTTPKTVRAAFLPLLDAAILVAAERTGIARAHGLSLELVRETAWANVRDRMAVGHFDVAHMLAPLALSTSLDLSPIRLDLVAPMVLGSGGNTVTVAREVADAMRDAGWDGTHDAAPAGEALAALGGRAPDGERLVLGVVHLYSGHHYELRYWLSACGVDPDRDVDLVQLPPPLMPDALAAGHIHGFCAGEPWGSVAVERADAAIVTTKSSIWRGGTDKVLAVSKRFAEERPETLAALLRALGEAAKWASEAGNHAALAKMLAAECGPACAPLLASALRGELPSAASAARRDPVFFVPAGEAVTRPDPRHALWFFSQMVRWGHARGTAENAARAAAIYRPDLYDAATGGAVAPLPGDAPVHGFFDGRPFAPESTGWRP